MILNKLLYLCLVAVLMFGCTNANEDQSSTNGKDMDADSELPPSFTSGLLLGVGDSDHEAKTYWIRFSDAGAEIDSMVGYYLSPQKDGFYIIQEVSHDASVHCEFIDHDGSEAQGICGWNASQLLIAKPDKYKSEFQNKKDIAETIAKGWAFCGNIGSSYEIPVVIGNGFVEYTIGGQSGECAPDGPGGGFDKDTVISIRSEDISPYVYRHVSSSQLNQAYAQLTQSFKKNEDGTLDSNSFGFFTSEEMPVHFAYKHGQVSIYARNIYGRNHQDTWEQEVEVGPAPAEFQSNEFPAYGHDLIKLASDKENYIISPVDSTYGIYNGKEGNIIFYTYPEKKELLKIDVNYANLVMVEWCDAANIDKWGTEVQSIRAQVEE